MATDYSPLINIHMNYSNRIPRNKTIKYNSTDDQSPTFQAPFEKYLTNDSGQVNESPFIEKNYHEEKYSFLMKKNENLNKVNIMTESDHSQEVLIQNQCSRASLFESNIIEGRFSSKYRVRYNFSTDLSRKKERKEMRNKRSKFSTRVHNLDSMMKKIKSKYLKFLVLSLKNLIKLEDSIGRFNQVNEVRNLNVEHNKEEFIDLTVLEYLINSEIVKFGQLSYEDNKELEKFLGLTVKDHYNFYFLNSSYYEKWMKDPVDIEKFKEKNKQKMNKNCSKFKKHSKNIFLKSNEDYKSYIKMLFRASTDFIFYFQNNPMKYGRRLY